MLDGKILFPTLKSLVEVNVPSGRENGKVLRLPRLGMSIYNASNHFGNIYVMLTVQLPKQLTEAELELSKKLADVRSH